ncbi:hypothetical protein DRW41_05370 [Neobacillus piezotolerans]|uniref:Uncharacterized protein n=1 Tax=Neobacillus piezotolerans TaxID=2259171 RepID=A0A3D8GS27_9BACI|nr:hypothetical protein [Neobacillus piezotolerans]RDU37284.1 hypothetical protein DRW41_05370 [Neobacillus piezotolerans]
MDKEQLLTLAPSKRIEEVNRLLKNHTLKEIATMYNFAYSTFTTEMRSDGKYHYSKKSKQYVAVALKEDNEEKELEIFDFIKENRHTLQRLIEMANSRNLLLDERVYSKTATYENKSIKMNKQIYSEFAKFCDTNYPHLKVQDLVAQSLMDFMERYKR